MSYRENCRTITYNCQENHRKNCANDHQISCTYVRVHVEAQFSAGKTPKAAAAAPALLLICFLQCLLHIQCQCIHQWWETTSCHWKSIWLYPEYSPLVSATRTNQHQLVSLSRSANKLLVYFVYTFVKILVLVLMKRHFYDEHVLQNVLLYFIISVFLLQILCFVLNKVVLSALIVLYSGPLGPFVSVCVCTVLMPVWTEN